MTQENHSSKSEEQESKELKELKKKAENLQKILDMTNKTLEHDKKFKGFGKYEMM